MGNNNNNSDSSGSTGVLIQTHLLTFSKPSLPRDRMEVPAWVTITAAAAAQV